MSRSNRDQFDELVERDGRRALRTLIHSRMRRIALILNRGLGIMFDLDARTLKPNEEENPNGPQRRG
jgi:hypothetical protein